MQVKLKLTWPSFHFLFFDMINAYDDNRNSFYYHLPPFRNYAEKTSTCLQINKALSQEQQFTPAGE